MTKYYLRIDGVNLGNFVYDADDLNTIRGGSLLLLHSMQWLQDAKLPVKLEPVSTGASIGLFSFQVENDEQARKVCTAVDALLKQELTVPNLDGIEERYNLKHATFVVSIQPVSGDFVYDTEAGLAKNRWKQMQQPSLAIPSLSTADSVTGNCDFDLVRPGIHPINIGERTKKMSESVKIRRQYGSRQKQRFYQIQTERKEGIPGKYSNDLDGMTTGKGKGNLNHKMAIIYLDGNKFSQLRNQECRSEALLKEFDLEIKKYRKDMLTKLLTDIMACPEGWFEDDTSCRMETLLWGGDEIMWAVPAWKGWDVLSSFYTQTVEKGWNFKGVPLKHGASIVFCHHNAPIPKIKELAKDLADLAKKDSTHNMFAYQVLESFDSIGRYLEGYMSELCPKGCNIQSLILNGENMGTITSIMKEIKTDEQFPRNKVFKIVDQLLNDSSNAITTIKDLEDNLDDKNKKRLDALDACLNGPLVKWVHIQQLWDYVGL